MLQHLLCNYVGLSLIRSTHLNRFSSLTVVLTLKDRDKGFTGKVDHLN